MKKYLFLLLTAPCFILQPARAENPELKTPEYENLPHAFDAGWKGQKTCEVLFEDQTVRVGRCIFPPGSGHEKHYHNPHFGYVLEGGTLYIRDDQGGRKVTTESAGTWSTSRITVHEAENVGDTTTSYLIVEPKVSSETLNQ
jgi:quercetin dioxygenase-like cupin family protein